VGAILALSALGTVAVLQGSPDEVKNAGPLVVLPLAFGTACGIGALCGLFNGLLVVLLRIHPFIVTLGTLYFFRGLALVLIPTKTLPTVGNAMPDAFVEDFMAWQMQLGSSSSFIQPTPMLIMLGVVVVGWFYLQHTTMGRRIYAVGGNEEAARFSGVAVWRVKLGVYVLSGLTAGLAGAVMAGFNGSANTATGNMYELIVIASAVVGGASLVGGRGTALGALLGTIVIMLIDNGIFVLDWNKEYTKAITGIAIIIAVAVDRFSRYLSERRLAVSRGKARLA
jgi:ribose/xylose/arabinose/galactoside ABC-type transport system permease subunit